MKKLSIIYPFYQHCKWLHFMMKWLNDYPSDLNIEVIIIDDGSPKSILDEIRASNLLVPSFVKIYRIEQDIPWNQGGAYNLGAHLAESDWLLKLDFDHFIYTTQLKKLIALSKQKDKYYKFQRRNYFKNKVVKVAYGPQLVSKETFWKAGGHDEDFSGHIGAYPFYLYKLKKIATEVILDNVFIFMVNPTKEYPDSSVSLDRNRKPLKILYKKKVTGQILPSTNFLRFDWERIL